MVKTAKKYGWVSKKQLRKGVTKVKPTVPSLKHLKSLPRKQAAKLIEMYCKREKKSKRVSNFMCEKLTTPVLTDTRDYRSIPKSERVPQSWREVWDPEHFWEIEV